MEENQEQPIKYTRITVMAVYADGSSRILDIPEPADVKTAMEPLYEITELFKTNPYGIPSVLPIDQELTIRVRISPKKQIREFISPIPEV